MNCEQTVGTFAWVGCKKKTRVPVLVSNILYTTALLQHFIIFRAERNCYAAIRTQLMPQENIQLCSTLG